MLVNDRWFAHWSNAFYKNLPPRTLDHSPLVLSENPGIPHTGSFLFDNYLVASSDFIPSVRSTWRRNIIQNAIFVVTRNLKALKQDIIDEFLGYYQRLLGGDRDGRYIHIRYLKPWTRHIVTANEASQLVAPVMKDEIKNAFFNIVEDKSQGLDGYSSGFFKVAWPVIGEQVSQVVMDFFITGRLLKQVNVTLLTLIPQVQVPATVADLQPISCCNVLCKAITKIIVQLMPLLDHIISPSKNFFIPERSISDNILLAQELLYSYNQKRLPPRCALKVDLRKAYDIVECDFLLATLKLFGFLDRFTGWLRSV
ncbi:UNVERIFIED_CONTAM: hypothetical protein Sradi_3970100 [Sesamum radiatum]|uniref:Reverse transcriptase domain-containing protein n=1 Tax=Sesamum radiatum TaxID=300843 RepID=A0AAW2PG49_SESRA